MCSTGEDKLPVQLSRCKQHSGRWRRKHVAAVTWSAGSRFAHALLGKQFTPHGMQLSRQFRTTACGSHRCCCGECWSSAPACSHLRASPMVPHPCMPHHCMPHHFTHACSITIPMHASPLHPCMPHHHAAHRSSRRGPPLSRTLASGSATRAGPATTTCTRSTGTPP